MNDWTLVYEGFEPERERLRESLCTLGNGYFATRGAASEVEADDIHYPGTYVAGGYNRLKTDIAGRTVENEDLVNLPNWLPLTFRPKDGTWFSARAVDILSYRQELDIKRGILLRTLRFQDNHGRRTMLTSRRFVHLGNHHLAGLETTITAENWSGPLHIRSSLDGRVLNAGVARYQSLSGKHLEPLETRVIDNDGISLLVETNQSRLRVAEAASTRFFCQDSPIDIKREIIEEPGYIGQECIVDITERQPLTIEKILALHTSRDHAISECGLAAQTEISHAGRFSALVTTHSQRWERLWQRCDIVLDDGNHSQLILRLHIFHLLQTVSPNSIDLDIGVPARGLHGEAYRGHVFWDELFIFPYSTCEYPTSLDRFYDIAIGASTKQGGTPKLSASKEPCIPGKAGVTDRRKVNLSISIRNPVAGTRTIRPCNATSMLRSPITPGNIIRLRVIGNFSHFLERK